MAAAWVAGSVRARLLLQHRAGPETALLVAQAGSLEEAVGLLSTTGAAVEARGASLEAAQRAVAATLALRIRLLAAWLPRDGVAAMRALAGWFELVNVEDRLAYFTGAELRTPYELGMLSSVWARAAAAQSADEVRRLLAASSWGDPGSDDRDDVHLALRLAWARRVSTQVPVARAWAAGAVALLLAGELFVAERPVDDDLVRRVRLGGSWAGAASIAELREELPAGRGLGARRRRRPRRPLAGRARLVAQGRSRCGAADPDQSRRQRGRDRRGRAAGRRRDAAHRRARSRRSGWASDGQGGLRCPLLTSSCRSG